MVPPGRIRPSRSRICNDRGPARGNACGHRRMPQPSHQPPLARHTGSQLDCSWPLPTALSFDSPSSPPDVSHQLTGPRRVIAQCRGRHRRLRCRPERPTGRTARRLAGRDPTATYGPSTMPPIPTAQPTRSRSARSLHLQDEQALGADLQTCEKPKGAIIIISSLGAACRGTQRHTVHWGRLTYTMSHQQPVCAGSHRGRVPTALIAVAAGAGGHAGSTSPFHSPSSRRSAAGFDGPLALSNLIATSRRDASRPGRRCRIWPTSARPFPPRETNAPASTNG